MVDLKNYSILLVPGFLAQVYKAVNKQANALSTQGLIDAAKSMIPHFGDQVASLIPKLALPVDPDSGVSFSDHEKAFHASGVACTDMGQVPAFDTQASVAANAAAIRNVLSHGAETGRKVLIVSHSKGGLDTLDALITANDTQRSAVCGWLAIQAPFLGSPLASIGSAVLTSLGLDMAAMTDLRVSVRAQYMSQRTAAIAKLVGDMPVTCAYSSYKVMPDRTLGSLASAVVKSIFGTNWTTELLNIGKANAWHYWLPPQALAHDITDVINLIAARRNEAIKNVMSSFGVMDVFNVLLNLKECNDGLVPESSAKLPGSKPVRLSPDTDHAGPIMSVTPFKNFWTRDQRVGVTRDLLMDLVGRASARGSSVQ